MKVRTHEQQSIVAFWAAVDMTNKHKKPGPCPEGYRSEKHIPYIQDYNEDHQLNLYYPKDYRYPGEKLPTVINIHGGGWLFGHVDDSELYMAALATEGYAVMGMGYRLIPVVDMQGIVQDIYESLHWLEKYGPVRGFDLDHVMLTGDSAGGHLSLLVACIQQSQRLQEIYGVKPVSFPITTVTVSCPCVEMDELYIVPSDSADEAKNLSDAYRELMMGEQGEDAPWSRYLSFSQFITQVPDVKMLPPIYLIGSENESLHFQTRKLLQEFDRYEINYETKIWKKEDGQHLMHVFNVEHWEWYESLISNRAALEFFRAHCE